MRTIKFTKQNIVKDKYGTPFLNLGETGKVMLDEMNDKTYVAELKQYREKRSNDANSYCWVLLNKLANRLDSTKEALYREFIKEKAPKIEFIAIKESAVKAFTDHWEKNGIGWQSVVDGDAKKMPGYKRVELIYGSSSFDSKEMSIFIDWVVEACKEQSIETLTPRELEALKQNWRQ